MSNPINDYLNLTARYPLLTPEQEIQLSRQVQAMNALNDITDLTPQQQRIKRRGIKARNTIVNANLRLVVHIAKRYIKRLKGNGMDLMDLIQEGNIGLHRAAELFDGARGYKFSTYAYWWIRQAITRAVDTQERIIRLPQHSVERLYRAIKLQEEYTRQHGKPATMAELAGMLEVATEELEILMARAMTPRSLDQLINEDGSPLIDMIADERTLDPSYAAAEMEIQQEQLNLAFFRLDKNDRDILSKRYGLGSTREHTVREIARESGVTRQRITQRVQIAERKLRFMVATTAA